MGKADFDLYKQNAVANPNCNMQIVGNPLQQISGAWPYMAAFGPPFCTSLVEATLSALIVGASYR